MAATINGPQNYEAATNLANQISGLQLTVDQQLQLGILRATLALAAATAMAAPYDEMPKADQAAWMRVAGVDGRKVVAR